MKPVSIFWFRRDLRLEDNTGLEAALKSGHPVLPLFIFDEKILNKLEDKEDRRVEFIHNTLEEMQETLAKHGSTFIIEHGEPLEIWKKLVKMYDVKSVYLNHDYEPYAIERDIEVGKIVRASGAEYTTFKDQVIFERLEVEKGAGGSYSVFTPYSRKWKELLKPAMLKARDSETLLKNLVKLPERTRPTLAKLGFKSAGLPFPPATIDKKLVQRYGDQRNFPYLPGTSHLGMHLRFGTVSVRHLVKEAQKLSDVWLGELIWREFFMQILWNYPDVIKRPFRPEYENIKWRNNKEDFERWCTGTTGYPIVDAGMRELNETGFMHNRVRMVTGSFLVKHLLIDWRWGEEYFARKLLDFELSSNNGNWQWVAGCGCDAAPYFRVFNPHEQQKKFDPDQIYARTWIPELGTKEYPDQIVDHKFARERVLKVYKEGLHR